MTIASPLAHLRCIDEQLAAYGYVGRLLGGRRPSVYICEPTRVLEELGAGVAVAVDGLHPLRTLDPGECVWDVLCNRITVSPAYMLAQMFAPLDRADGERAYAAEQASGECYEAADHMDRIHVAVRVEPEGA